MTPEEKRTRSEKLNPRAELGIVIGYEGENIYKIWVPSVIIKGNKDERYQKSYIIIQIKQEIIYTSHLYIHEIRKST